MEPANGQSVFALGMKTDHMISRAIDFAAYCYEAAERCGQARQTQHQEYLLLQAKKWERHAHNIQRDTNAIVESMELLARLHK